MVGEKVRVRRKELDITLEELSVETGIDVSSLSKIENGKKDVDNIEVFGKLCKALHVKVSYFFANSTN